MTKTSTHPNPSRATSLPDHGPTAILINLIVTFLTPMFLDGCGGDIAFARLAASKTLNVYCARNDEEMISIVQVIAFGFAALMSISRSMEDEVSVLMMLRLHGNANACNRSAENNRRALRECRARVTAQPGPVPRPSPDDGYDQAGLDAIVASALQRTGPTAPAKPETSPPVDVAVPARSVVLTPVAAPARPADLAAPLATPLATPTAPTPAPSPADVADRENQLALAAGMALVAAKYAADLPNLSPQERLETSMWASALSTCAHELMDGEVGPRPQPGDLSWLSGRPNSKS